MKIPYVIDNQTHKIADIRHVTSLSMEGGHSIRQPAD